MEQVRVGFAFCGSFCTFDQSMAALERVVSLYKEVTPIVSEQTAQTDTRYGNAHDVMREMERICDKRVISTLTAAEPIGPEKLLDVLVIAPCTGNTLAKLAHGMTDGPVTMAVKAHLRNGGPVVVAIATNDGLSTSLQNIGTLLCRKHYYFVPFGQDDPTNKPNSLLADMKYIPAAIEAALAGKQLQPLLLGPAPA